MTVDPDQQVRRHCPPRQEISLKMHAYGEGVIHGFEAAATRVHDLTGGLLTLAEPAEITAWRDRLKRAVIVREGE